MKKCAFLTTDNLEAFFVYDSMLFSPLADLGWQCEEVSWRSQVDWDQYDVVVIRSTWDYQQDPDAFMSVLANIDSSSAILANSLPLVKWNIDKRYLKDLQAQGIGIVPSIWAEQFDPKTISTAFAALSTNELVIKPFVSANADHTYRLKQSSNSQQVEELKEAFSNRGHIIQPFMASIIDEGEYSLFYFSGQYSHAILKVPKADDFRVQEEHGGQLRSIEPTKSMLAVAEQTLAALPDDALYARIDLVRSRDEFLIMEVELIEPSLYFNMAPNSAKLFAQVFAQTYGHI